MKKFIALYGKTTLFIALLFLSIEQQVFAAEISEVDYLEKITTWIKAAAKVGILLISVVAFVWVSWIILAKFNEARKNGEVADVILVIIVGAGVLVMLSLLLSTANTFIV